MDLKTIALAILFMFMKITTYFLEWISKYYPFSVLFKDRYFHKNWIGVDRIVSLIDLCSHGYDNRFLEETVESDNYFFYITGKFDKNPDPEIFESVQKQFKEEGWEIRIRSEVEKGKYEFTAPIKQNWRWVWY